MLPSDVNPVDAKQRFAAALLRHPHEPFKAAMLVFPRNSAAAVFILNEWTTDEYVLQHMRELVEENGSDHYLPSKFELAHEVYHTATQARDVEAKIKAYKLFADIQGHINKPAAAVVNNTQIKQNVLVVREYDDKTVEQAQAKLLREMAEDAA